MKKNTKLKFKRFIAALLAVLMVMSLSACRTPSEFYHEVILGETTGKKKEKKEDKDKDKDKEEKTEAEKEDTSEEDVEYADEENPEFQEFLMEYFEDTVTASTMVYNDYIMDASKFDVKMEGEATLGDASMDEEAMEAAKKEDEKFYDELLEFEDADLTEDERFTFECLKYDTEISMRAYDYTYLAEPFSPMSGAQENIPTAFEEYRFDDKQDVEDYITLINQVRNYFGKLIDFEYEKSEKGYFMSDDVADDVIEQCDEVIDKNGSFICEVFEDNIDKLDFLSDEEKDEFKAQNKEAVEEVVVPAYQDVKDCLEELKGTGKNDGGLCNFEGGKEYYEEYLFPVYSGSAKTMDEEIEVMDDRMDDLLMQLTSIYMSNPDAYEDYVEKNDNLYSVYDDMTAEEMIDMFQEDYMDDYPIDGKIPYEVDYLSDSISKIKDTTLAYYNVCPIDNPDYNRIKVNSINQDGLFNTLAHEGCPGHMFQFWYFRNTNPNPGRTLDSNLGYVEGWAVYTAYNATLECDFLGKEENAKVLASLDKINTDMGYLAQARIDVGINYEGWSVEDVEDYLEEKGFNKDVAEDIFVTSIGDPGVYFSYTTGYYEMEELRNKAEEELGSKFEAKEFHKAILDAGPCQFEMLEKKVDKYIEENK